MNNIQPTTGLSHLVHANLNKQSNSPKKKLPKIIERAWKEICRRFRVKLGFSWRFCTI